MTPEFLTVAGLKLRYVDTGGPGLPIVLSHGISGSLELWSNQIAGLGGTHRIIAWDAPNHGLSDLTGKTEGWDSYAGWLLAFVDALGLDRFVLAGNSMGAAVSLRVAGLVPERVQGLFLANAAALGPEVFPVFKLMTLPLLGALMTRPSEKSVDRALGAIVKDQACISADLRAAMLRNQFKDGGAAAFHATLCAGTSWRGQRPEWVQASHRLLASLDTPMVVLHGRDDAVLPLKHSENAAAMAKNARLVVFDDCGHTPQIEKPDAFNETLTAFVAGLR